jgi:hypothetical protein
LLWLFLFEEFEHFPDAVLVFLFRCGFPCVCGGDEPGDRVDGPEVSSLVEDGEQGGAVVAEGLEQPAEEGPGSVGILAGEGSEGGEAVTP